MRSLLAAVIWFFAGPALGLSLTPPAQSRQLVIAVGETTEASEVQVHRFQRADASAPWVQVGGSVPARIGKNGMAWGRGMHGESPASERRKREGDWRAPMGLFRIGDAFGDAPAAPSATEWTYHKVTPNDLWVEDSTAATYNQHIRVPADRPRTEWEESQRMKMGDPAHRLKIVIQHNFTPNILSGAGSAIFFHIWRQDGARPTSGCTAMAAAELELMLGWLEPGAAPVYVLIDQARYTHAKDKGELP